MDNGSEDGSAELLRSEFPWVELIENKKNLGFSEGNNVGISYALGKKADYIALLNNDTEVDSNWLGELVGAAESDSKICVCGSKILFFDHRNVVNSVGHAVNRLGYVWDDGIWEKDSPDYDQPKEIIGACGAAFLARANTLRESGLFDKGYFAYYEDVDLSIRIRKLGHRIVYVPTALVYHKFSITSGEGSYFKNYLGERNHYRFFLKLFPIPLVLRGLPLLAGFEFVRTVKFILKADWTNAGLKFKVLGATIVALPEIIGFRFAMARRTKDGSFWSLIKKTDAIPDFRSLRREAIGE